MKIGYKILIGVVIGVALFLAGFFLGRAKREEVVKIKTEYITLDPIYDTITSIQPVSVVKPADTLGILKQCVKDGIYSEILSTNKIHDTVYMKNGKVCRDTVFVGMNHSDTTKIMYDWATIRKYNQNLFNIDTIGSCSVDMIIRYNRLDSLSYIFTPVRKEVTITKEKTRIFSPYIGLGAMSLPSFDAEVGFYVKEHYGLGVKYQYDIINKKHVFGGMLYYKF